MGKAAGRDEVWRHTETISRNSRRSERGLHDGAQRETDTEERWKWGIG